MLSVQQRFNHASQTYDEVATIQKMCARKLCEKIMMQCSHASFSSVLDLGSGTGYMAEALLPYFPQSTFTLTDFAPNMLMRAEQKFRQSPNIRYQCADFANDRFDFHQLTVSNLAFQWVDDLERVILKHFNNTQTLAFSCLLSGTFDEWHTVLRQYDERYLTRPYPTEDFLMMFLAQQLDAKVVTTSEDYDVSFPNAYSLIRYLKALGATKSDAAMSLPTIKKMIAHDLPINMKYRVFYGVIQQW